MVSENISKFLEKMIGEISRKVRNCAGDEPAVGSLVFSRKFDKINVYGKRA